MYENEKNIRVRRTKQAILDAVIALSREKPFPSIRISEIADKAGINRKTFYVYYDSLDDFIFHLKAELGQKFRPLLMQVDLKGDYFDTYSFFVEAISIVQQDMEVYRMLFSTNMLSILLDDVQSEMLKVFLSQYNSEDPKRDERYRMLGKYAGAGLLSAVTEWIARPDMPLEEFAHLMGSISLSAYRAVEAIG